MDVILEFKSKQQNIWWEKVYSAREIMKIFWYDKWERFLWAVNRAKDELNNEKKINKNFSFIIDKKTWWRPKEDVLLTLGACYLVLKKCDNRKENVDKLLKYLKNILEVEKQKSIQNNLSSEYIKISWGKILLIFIIIFLLSILIYYFNSYFKLTNQLDLENISKDIQNKNKQIIIQNKTFKNYDEKILKIKNKEENIKINNWEVEAIQDINFSDILNSYIKDWWNVFKYFNNNFNYRSDFSMTIVWENLIKSYFEFWNKWLYKDSCSLLSKKLCLATSLNLSWFSNFWEKTKSWYENIKIKKVKFNWSKKVYCVSYKYKLKYDLKNDYISETFNYTTEIKNWYEQIIQRFCEKIEKWWRQINCPYKLENYYCN